MKLCLSIAPTTTAEAIEKLKSVESTVDLVEVRVDCIQDLDLQKLLRKPRPKVIITNRREEEGGKFSGSSAQQYEILSEALRHGAEFVDIELSWGLRQVRQQLKRLQSIDSRAKVIVSYHNFNSAPSNLLSIYENIRNVGAPIVKIAVMAADIKDNRKIFELCRQARSDKQPIIAICMGEKGEISRILTGKYGAYLTFGALRAEEPTAPGQRTTDDLTNIFRIHTLTSRTKVFGLVGNPVALSKGIYFHNRIFNRRTLNAVYVNFLVDNLRDFLSTFRELTTGLSVTMPFKQEIIPYIDTISHDALALKSANTVIKRRGRLHGYNTDLPAIVSALRKRTSLKNKDVIVLGTGATSKTMAYGTAVNGARVTIIGRNATKAKTLAGELNCNWATLSDVSSLRADIIMNGTSVGMSSNSGVKTEELVPKKFFRREMIVFDAVHSPSMTRLLREAQDAGCTTITGAELFERQARLQSKFFVESIQ